MANLGTPGILDAMIAWWMTVFVRLIGKWIRGLNLSTESQH